MGYHIPFLPLVCNLPAAYYISLFSGMLTLKLFSSIHFYYNSEVTVHLKHIRIIMLLMLHIFFTKKKCKGGQIPPPYVKAETFLS